MSGACLQRKTMEKQHSRMQNAPCVPEFEAISWTDSLKRICSDSFVHDLDIKACAVFAAVFRTH